MNKQSKIHANTGKKPDHYLTVVADMGDEKSLFKSEFQLFIIGYDFVSDDESSDFIVRSFELKTGLKKFFRGKENELIIPMPKESFDFAEALLWAKAKEDSDFLELLEKPELAECGHDLYLF